MEKLNLFVASVIMIVVQVQSNDAPVRVAPSIYVTSVQEGQQSSLNLVNGYRSCGGQGKLIAFRCAACQPHQEICQVPGDGRQRAGELEFIPSQDTSGLGFLFLIVLDGEVIKAYEQEISDSSVLGGEQYVVHTLGGVSDKLKGKTVLIQFILYQVEDSNVEICAEGDFQIV